jgi:DNA polymerase-3 subunit delta'
MQSLPTQAVAMPWQMTHWQRFRDLLAADRLPHAILLTGSAGTGKLQFAHALAGYLLCSAPTDGLACHQCRSCQLLQSGTHPDLQWLQPEEAGKRIKVDHVRLLVGFLTHTSQQGGKKVAIISPAESMNINAANALLKSLEEPAADTFLLLVADSPARLLPTIRSRCQLTTLPKPDSQQSMAWLAQFVVNTSQAEALLLESSGEPLTALKLLESDGLERSQLLDKGFYNMLQGRQSTVGLAAQMLEYELVDILLWLLRRIQGLIKHLQAGTPLTPPWTLLPVANCKDLFCFSDSLSILLNSIQRGASPNRQLLIEGLLLASCDVFHT